MCFLVFVDLRCCRSFSVSQRDFGLWCTASESSLRTIATVTPALESSSHWSSNHQFLPVPPRPTPLAHFEAIAAHTNSHNQNISKEQRKDFCPLGITAQRMSAHMDKLQRWYFHCFTLKCMAGAYKKMPFAANLNLARRFTLPTWKRTNHTL